MVTVVTCTNRQNMENAVLNNFLRQNFRPKELIILLNNKNMNVELWRKKTAHYGEIRIYQLDNTKTLGECLNFASERSYYNVIARFDDDDYYSPDYLTNMVGQLEIKKTDVIGKSSIFIYFTDEKKLSLFRRRKKNTFLRKESDLKRPLAGGTLVFKKEVLKIVPFSQLNLGEDLKFQKDCLRQGLSVFSTDPYDYVLIRYKSKQHQHTWNADPRLFQKNSHLIAVTNDFDDLIRRPHIKDGTP
ncbi:glycosyltransferase [Sporolactobacillus vineae]|uniref:glycosyltransferase n=1 Tax=Sporolactobacillus vineae TaxID=444463 RepID=UPI00031BCAEC|nr:glycosyltransferase [Sporolactobacillus vineae]